MGTDANLIINMNSNKIVFGMFVAALVTLLNSAVETESTIAMIVIMMLSVPYWFIYKSLSSKVLITVMDEKNEEIKIYTQRWNIIDGYVKYVETPDWTVVQEDEFLFEDEARRLYPHIFE